VAVQAGRYRHQVQLQEDTGPTQNAAGEESPNFTTVQTLRALVTITAAELKVTAAETTRITHYKVEHRYYAALAGAPANRWRYLWQGFTLNIALIGWDDKKLEMFVTATSRDLQN
jgi:head-tail adaptor